MNGRSDLAESHSVDITGSVLSFHNVEYKVQIKKGMCGGGGAYTKEILKGIEWVLA